MEADSVYSKSISEYTVIKTGLEHVSLLQLLLWADGGVDCYDPISPRSKITRN